jgi:outer membrane protein TolC
MPLGKRIAPILALLLLLPPVPASAQKIPVPDYSLSAGNWPSHRIYMPEEVPQANLSDSPRLESLIRGGVLYLSLADAVALAIENNLDIAYARYAPLQADTDILRARAGANLSGVQTQISTLSTAQSVATPGGGGGGGGFQQGQATGITVAASQQAAGGAAGEVTSFFGTQVTNLDPTFSGSMTVTRQSNPQISDFVTGTNTLIQDFDFYSFNYNQGFTTGTTVQLGFTTVAASNNNLRNNFNPTLTSDLSLNIRQPLTQGFGREINGRQIRIAKNRREQQDLAFKDQVIDTVKRIQDLYWDLVGLIAEVEARKNDLQLSENLLRDNTRSVELGLMAGVELLSAKAEASTNRNTLVRAETNVRLQEEVLKNAITKHGPTSDRLANVRIVPTDSVPIPNVDRVEPLQDLITLALSSRPSLVQARMELHNSDLNLKGIRNAMLPRVDVTAFATNNALAGSVNSDFIGGPNSGAPSDFFLGGLGTALSQVFRRNFPDYGVRFDLNMPLRNRQAQADMTRETLSRRRQDIRLLQSENNVKLEVSRALTSLMQTRDAYQTAKEAREFREQMLEAEHKKFDFGSSTIFQIVQAQRDLGNARVSEIGAINSYVKAQVDLDRVVGGTLERNAVLGEEAFQGEMTRNPDPPPVMHSGPSTPQEK